jgi:hypothetical protein
LPKVHIQNLGKDLVISGGAFMAKDSGRNRKDSGIRTDGFNTRTATATQQLTGSNRNPHPPLATNNNWQEGNIATIDDVLEGKRIQMLMF